MSRFKWYLRFWEPRAAFYPHSVRNGVLMYAGAGAVVMFTVFYLVNGTV